MENRRFPRKAIYKGINLEEGDLITNSIDGDSYIIKDFKDNGTPIVDLVTNTPTDYFNKEWEFNTIFVIKAHGIL